MDEWATDADVEEWLNEQQGPAEQPRRKKPFISHRHAIIWAAAAVSVAVVAAATMGWGNGRSDRRRTHTPALPAQQWPSDTLSIVSC